MAATRRDQRSPAVIGLAGSHWSNAPSGQPRTQRLQAFRPADDTTPAPPNVIAACRAKLRN